MALSTYSPSNSSSIFQEDDEETWKLLASSDRSSDLGQRLTSLARRFEEDHPSNAVFWDGILEQLHSRGFRYSSGEIQKLSTGGATLHTKPPLAFESEAGKLHLEATAALLCDMSPDRAVQVTLSALTSIDSDNDGTKFQSLLGGRDLLWKTLLHHQQQRLARLGALTECLRLEQDLEAPSHSHVHDFLDSLDSLYKDEDRYRGLFRRLLTIACAPTITPRREQLEPAKALHSDQSRSRIETMSPEREWNSFCSAVVEEQKMQQMRERREALEALLVLMYSHINEGVRRADYAIFLLAYQSTHDFFAESPVSRDSTRRLVQLAALICAECAALWRTVDSDSNSSWASHHPLLLEISTSGKPQVAQNEICALSELLWHMVREALLRRGDGATEALALLSFGILLRLAHACFQASEAEADSQTIWSSFGTMGGQMVQTANDEYGAFDFLLSVLDELTYKTPFKRSAAVHDQLYDWLLADNKHTLLLEDGSSSGDTAPDTTAYTSIAREVLAAAIAAFEDSVLAIDQSNSCENISMLCNIGAKVFQNNSVLCEQFWADWEVYSNGSTSGFPICKLLDSSHRMTIAALQAYTEHNIRQELFVQAVAPFFQLLSTLCHTTDLVETTLTTFPDGLLRQALLCCRVPSSSTGMPNHEYHCSRSILLMAIGRLAKFGNSKTCLHLLRCSLEEPLQDSTDGPRVLSRLINDDENAIGTLEPVLAIMAHLLDSAPQPWALQLAREIMESNNSKRFGLAQCFSSGQGTVHSASLVLAELIDHLTAVVFSDRINEQDAEAFLHCITESLLSAASTLASSISVQVVSQESMTTFSFETAQTIMQSLSNFLRLIRTVIQLHGSLRVRETGMEVRDAIVNALATSTGIGQSIIYYATAPVSLTLAIKLQAAIEDQSILQQVADEVECDAGNPSNFGAWKTYLSQHQRDPIKYLAKHVLVDFIGKLTCDEIELEGIVARNWANVSDIQSPLHTAYTAIRLLSQWASHIEDSLATSGEDQHIDPLHRNDTAKLFIEAKSPYRLLSSLATSPIPCRGDNTMESVWGSAGLSNFELLLPYLANRNVQLFDSVLSTPLLDLVHACPGHVSSINSQDTVTDSVLYRALHRSPRFMRLLVDSILRSLELSHKSGHATREDKALLLDGIFSLRVLASCVASNPSFANHMVNAGGDTIISKMISVTSEVRTCLFSNGGPLCHDESDIIKLRLATGCLAVLSSLWQSIHSLAPNGTGPSSSRLIDKVDCHGSFITELVTAVSSFALSTDLEERIGSSALADHVRGTLLDFMAFALQILATEAAHESESKRTNITLQNFLLKDFVRSSRFMSFEGYERAAVISTELQNFKLSQSAQSIKILQCFPATSITRLAPDYVFGGNSFDASAAAYWLTQSCDIEEDLINNFVMNISASHQLVDAELHIIESWKRFSESVILYSSRLHEGRASTDRMFDFVQDTLLAFNMTLTNISKVQNEGGDLMLRECKQNLRCLADLVLFFLDMGARYSEPHQRPSFDQLLDTLVKLANSSELMLKVSLHTESGESDLISERSHLALATSVMASSVVVLGLLDSVEIMPDLDQTSHLHDAYTTICRANSRTLQMASNHLQSTQLPTQGRESHESFLCCVSLFTSLLSRNAGKSTDKRIYLKVVSEILPVFNVAEEVINQAIHSATQAAKSMSTENQSTSVYDHLLLVQCVLDFLFSIAEAGNADLLATLPEPKIAHLLVRNPLFQVLLTRGGNAMTRGYISSTSNTGHEIADFKVGEDDPVHLIWRASMKVLRSFMHASSDQGNRSLFHDMCMEFLQVYHPDLIVTLKSCGSKLTMNGMHEATIILGMVAELCKRSIRDQFQRAQRDLCLEFVSWSSFVVAVLAKFLGAAGTARELFYCVEKIHSETENFELGTWTKPNFWHPLLEEGVPSAKHEAVKFSHYASRCCQRVTATDFRASSMTTERLSSLSKSSDGDSDLERTSRLSITNEFAVRMERCAAACIEQAVAVLRRMHPASFSFHRISEAEMRQIDVMALVPIGTIIGFHPFENSGLIATAGLCDDSFEGISFGRVVCTDTIKRTWIVSPLQCDETSTVSRSGEPTCVVRVRQLAGFEDLACRKTIATYLPAPNHMTELENTSNKLSLGHLILILRWCHQESFVCEKEFVNAGWDGDNLCQRLAEEAMALLGTEISLHEENGSFKAANATSTLKVDKQIFELFADGNYLDLLKNGVESNIPSHDGRMKTVVEKSVWEAVRPQLSAEVLRYWKGKQDTERKRNEKRSLSNDALWYTGLHRTGLSQTSAFRGFR